MCQVFWWKVILAAWSFMWHKWNVLFFCIVSYNILLLCMRISILGHHDFFNAMSALRHLVFILFYFKKQNGMKKNKLKNEKNYKKNRDMKMNKMKAKWKYKKNWDMKMNKMKTKWKQNETKNIVNKIKKWKDKTKITKVSYVSSRPPYSQVPYNKGGWKL